MIISHGRIPSDWSKILNSPATAQPLRQLRTLSYDFQTGFFSEENRLPVFCVGGSSRVPLATLQVRLPLCARRLETHLWREPLSVSPGIRRRPARRKQRRHKSGIGGLQGPDAYSGGAASAERLLNVGWHVQARHGGSAYTRLCQRVKAFCCTWEAICVFITSAVGAAPFWWPSPLTAAWWPHL